MEDVLDVYQRPYDPLRPVVCLDETNRQLIEKRSVSARPGHPGLEDYEYRRCGVVDLFVAFEPLACKRVVKLTNTRTAVDFAHFLRELVDVHYSHCEKIVLVMDNLNIHSIASLYKAFDPATARQIARRLEIHYTPIHASWLNMAEIEIGILSRQCLPNPCLLLSSWLVRSTRGLYIETLLVLLSIGDFLPLMPDVNSENFILLSCNS